MGLYFFKLEFSLKVAHFLVIQQPSLEVYLETQILQDCLEILIPLFNQLLVLVCNPSSHSRGKLGVILILNHLCYHYYFSLFPPPEQQAATNLALLTTDPFGDAPHLAGLEPKLKSNHNTVSATDPKELKSLLDASKKVDTSNKAKLKVVPIKNVRVSKILFFFCSKRNLRIVKTL